MDISSIISEVRMAIDEEDVGIGAHIDTTLSLSLEVGIRTAAKQALRWLAVNAPAVLLDGSDETTDPGFIVTNSNPTISNKAIELPDDFVRVVRVRAQGWHRAITECILDTSEEYLALNDETATATADRPVAAIVLDNPKKLELWPYASGPVTVTLSCIPSQSISQLDGASLSAKVPIPPKVHLPFIYYTAYLLLLSYKDSAAAAYRDVALTALGMNQK
jgi:hypothetical protein